MDGENLCGLPNFPDFDSHRHDQSILTNLKTKYGITTNESIRSYIECNMWEAINENDDRAINRKINLIGQNISYNTDSYNLWENEYLKILLNAKH
jgi:hypothetical protein